MKSLGINNNLMCLPINNTREWAVDFMQKKPRGYFTF